LPVAVGPLICFAAYIGLLQPHSDDMSRDCGPTLKVVRHLYRFVV
jgi:LmbE family N-acetylglucosaminyl deacetylase